MSLKALAAKCGLRVTAGVSGSLVSRILSSRVFSLVKVLISSWDVSLQSSLPPEVCYMCLNQQAKSLR